jgi:hypothetical protein
MDYQHASGIVDDLRDAVTSMDPERIRELFSALVILDGYRITQLAEQAMTDIDRDDLSAMCVNEVDPLHRLSMTVFYESMLAHLEEKSAEVETSVEHDVASWIDGNAAMAASANISIMEAALPVEDVHRSLIEFHHQIDFAACENEQTWILQRTWANIETRIKALLAGAGLVDAEDA